ncbi:MAG: Wadjet anti-phage system protein JetD domain-containing protein [Chloroflexota bacterium]
MEIPFTPSPDVAVVLNALLDIFERRRSPRSRIIKVSFTDVHLPSYFSQTEPDPRFTANEQLQILEQASLIRLAWVPGETNHLIDSVILNSEHTTRIYELLHRSAVTDQRSRLETTLLADQFRFSLDDWRTRAIHRTLTQLRAGKSPAPFSLTDSTWNLDLVTVLSALSTLETETPYRVFSVRTFNDSKRFDELKPAIVRLARYANPEWKTLTAEDILRELNLVANPSYIHMAGNWQLTTQNGENLSLDGFTPSIGFPAAQIETIQSVTIHADSVLCIENLTSFHEFIRSNGTRNTQHVTRRATLCLMGNPSPPIRRLLRLIPETIPIHLWSDMDYGGFNILSQLRKHVRPQIHPYLMDYPTFESHIHLSHPLTQADMRNLKRLCTYRELTDMRSILEHLVQRGLKLEQEAIQA